MLTRAIRVAGNEEARILKSRLDEQDRAATPSSSMTLVSMVSPLHPIPVKVKMRSTATLDPLDRAPRPPSKFALFRSSKQPHHPKPSSKVSVLPPTVPGPSNVFSKPLQDSNRPAAERRLSGLTIHTKNSLSSSVSQRRSPALRH